MKTSSTRTVLLGIAITASLCAYLFLSNVNIPLNYESADIIEYSEEQEESENKAVLPDVRLLKKVIEAGKQLIPAS